LLSSVMDGLLERVTEVGEELRAAADEDAKLGSCPASGHDLLIKYSPKTRGYFVGCSGYPDCSVTYPLPQAMRYESVEEPCTECGTPQVRIHRFKRKPLTRCLSPDCPTNQVEPLDLGACPVCSKEGRDGRIVRRVSQKTLKQFARCTEYDTCGVSYPLPQSGDIEPTGEVCEPCGSPVVVVTTRKGPWRICLDPECETKEQSASKKKGAKKPSAGSPRAKKRPASTKGDTKDGSKKPSRSA
jgi:DNA topoisomerase-1